MLKDQGIPFILLTNGGGKHETERVAEISEKLQVPLDATVLIQSHSPFAELAASLENKRVLVAGGDSDSCRRVAERYVQLNRGFIGLWGILTGSRYGFKNVITPADIFVANPGIWPVSKVFSEYYKEFARPIPNPVDPQNPLKDLKIDAMFVYNDPRDWGLDVQVILDILLSSQGYFGTISDKNGRADLPNRGYQQDGQPPLYFSNPDLFWAAAYHLPRLGQGGFREALEGVWAATTGGPSKGIELKKTIAGKPYQTTYEFAEHQLQRNRSRTFGATPSQPLRNVYMIGDNPASDICGANSFRSIHGSKWHSILVRTGIYGGGEPEWTPSTIADNVQKAVEWGMKQSQW